MNMAPSRLFCDPYIWNKHNCFHIFFEDVNYLLFWATSNWPRGWLSLLFSYDDVTRLLKNCEPLSKTYVNLIVGVYKHPEWGFFGFVFGVWKFMIFFLTTMYKESIRQVITIGQWGRGTFPNELQKENLDKYRFLIYAFVGE